MRLLVVNAGSTSLKLSVLDGDALLARPATLEDALGHGPYDAVGHRVVHGGDRTAPALLTDEVLAELDALTELAPLHQPPALQAVRRCRDALPDVPQVACFDTAFHTTIPEAGRTYALPRRLRERVRVFGFHGLSHAWASARVGELAPDARRVVVAHLGGGASLCAVRDGRSLWTTMGFTPLDGLVMATRSGAVDPGAVLWLAEHTDEPLDRVLESESGLLGLCGTGDMREVLDRADRGDPAAGLALEVYLHRLVRLLGSCVALLEGLDALVLTGGAGEHADRLRWLVSRRLGWLGVAVDQVAAGPELTASGARVRTFVVEAREDLQVAAEVGRLVRGEVQDRGR